MGNDVIKYKAGDNTVELSPDIIRQYLVSGDGKITDQEIMMFLKLCEYQQLNPFLREVYLIKFGSKPATMVTGKETFLKRAYRNPDYQGHKTGISLDGKIAWAEVYVKDYQTPIRCEVDFEEYVGRKTDGSINSIWKAKPNTMLKKVALVQALREAFPETFGGMYSQEEISTVDAEVLSTENVDPTRAVSQSDYITEQQLSELTDMLNNIEGGTEKEYLRLMKFKSMAEIPAKDYERAKQALIVAKKKSVELKAKKEAS